MGGSLAAGRRRRWPSQGRKRPGQQQRHRRDPSGAARCGFATPSRCNAHRWNNQIASFARRQAAASSHTPARLRGNTIAELPITALRTAYGRIETEMKTRRDEPGRALQVGAGASLNWRVLNRTRLRVGSAPAPGSEPRVSVMLRCSSETPIRTRAAPAPGQVTPGDGAVGIVEIPASPWAGVQKAPESDPRSIPDPETDSNSLLVTPPSPASPGTAYSAVPCRSGPAP